MPAFSLAINKFIKSILYNMLNYMMLNQAGHKHVERNYEYGKKKSRP